MKALGHWLFVCLCVVTILLTSISIASSVYGNFAYEDVYDVTYLEEVDATCVKTLYHGKATMDCLDGKRIEVTP